MKFRGDTLIIEKPLNDLDQLVLDVTDVLSTCGVQYATISGYVAVLLGRSRATEDIDVIVSQFDAETADELATRLKDAGFWGPNTPLDGMHATLSDELPVRIARDGEIVPNVEIKFPTDEYDRASLEDTVTVQSTIGRWSSALWNSRSHTSSVSDPRKTSRMPCISTRRPRGILTLSNSKSISKIWTSQTPMTDSNELDAKHERNRAQRLEQIKRWAEYVRTHPDEEWGKQVNTIVDAQLQSARHFAAERSKREGFRDPDRSTEE